MRKENKYITVAELLFELEGDRIHNDPDFHFQWNDWLEKYGKDSISFSDKFVTQKKDVKELATLIKNDCKRKVWNTIGDSIYDPEMNDTYGDFMTKKYEQQLADFTGVGTQLKFDIS